MRLRTSGSLRRAGLLFAIVAFTGRWWAALAAGSEGYIATGSGASELPTASHTVEPGARDVCSSRVITGETAGRRSAGTILAGGQISVPGASHVKPLVTRVRYRGATVEVVIAGGADRGGWRFEGLSPASGQRTAEHDRVDNALYIVDAATGELIWKAVRGPTGSVSNTVYQHADLSSSLSSTITALHSGSGIAHRLYLADTGGNLWRVDLPQGDAVDHRRDNWSLSRLARLGGARGDRQFASAPDVVESVDRHGEFDGVLIASGDRERPGPHGVDNYLFYLKDRLVDSGDRAARARVPITATELPDRSNCGSADSTGNCAQRLDKGWKLRLSSAGEDGLATPLVDAGRVYLTTFVAGRSRSGCASAPGRVLLYSLSLADATPIDEQARVREMPPGAPVRVVADGARIYFPRGAAVSDSVSIATGRWFSTPRQSGVPHFLFWRQVDSGDGRHDIDSTYGDIRADAP